MDYAERRLRQKIEQVPDGVYSAPPGLLEDDGKNFGQPLDVATRVVVRGSDVYIDLTGSNPQVETGFNCPFEGSVLPTANFAVRALLLDEATDGRGIPQNDGVFRPVHVIAPLGTIYNPIEPRGCEARFTQINRIPDQVLQALSAVLPEAVTAGNSAGVSCFVYSGEQDATQSADASGLADAYWVTIEVNEGSYGGRFGKDGLDAIDNLMANTRKQPGRGDGVDSPDGVRALRAERRRTGRRSLARRSGSHQTLALLDRYRSQLDRRQPKRRSSAGTVWRRGRACWADRSSIQGPRANRCFLRRSRTTASEPEIDWRSIWSRAQATAIRGSARPRRCWTTCSTRESQRERLATSTASRSIPKRRASTSMQPNRSAVRNKDPALHIRDLMTDPGKDSPFSGKRSLELAREMLALQIDSLGERDREQLQRLLLDHLACCYRGSVLPWGRKLHEWAENYRGAGRSGLFASAMKTSPMIAAFVNATSAHGLELDDTHDESVSHPGAAIIGTALALAQHNESSGAEILPAIVAGYEVTGRVGAATNAAVIIEKGFHPTCLFTGFGATATAAHLLKLTPQQLAQAWGLMLSMAGGSMQFSQEAEGTTVKRLHGGYSALHGVLAAEHSKLGIAGPEQALDGRYGLLANFGEQQDEQRLTVAHPNGPEIHRISFKPYPCCRLFHSTLDALAEATDGFTLDPDSIVSLRVGGPEIMVSQHMLRRPTSEMAAQYSLPFTLGAALYYGPSSVDGFMQDALGDERTLAIADRVVSELDPKMEEAFPEHFGSWIEVETSEGKRRVEVLDSLGTPANPISSQALIEKFDQLMAPTGFTKTGSEVAGELQGFAELDDLTGLLHSFLAAGTL